MIRSDDTAGLGGGAMTEMAHVRCQCLYLRCGSVRISSVVYSRLKQYLEASGILGLIGSCVNRKFVTFILDSNRPKPELPRKYGHFPLQIKWLEKILSALTAYTLTH